MERKTRREIVEEELTRKLYETGCFVEHCFAENKYDIYEYRWDFVKLIVQETMIHIKVEVNTCVESINHSEMDEFNARYTYTTEADYRSVIQRIYSSFVEIIFPKVNKMVEIIIEKNEPLGNQQTINWLTSELEVFFKTNENRNDKDIYYEIVQMKRNAYQAKINCISSWDDSKNEKQKQQEISKFMLQEMLACILYGEWIINGQGGHWKSKYYLKGYNKFVLVHPQLEHRMVDINQLFNKRCRTLKLKNGFSYNRDRKFWENN